MCSKIGNIFFILTIVYTVAFYSILMSRVTPPDLYEKISYVTGVQKFIRKVSAGSRGRPRIGWDGIRKLSYVTPVIRILRMDKFVSNVTPKTSYELSKVLQYAFISTNRDEKVLGNPMDY